MLDFLRKLNQAYGKFLLPVFVLFILVHLYEFLSLALNLEGALISPRLGLYALVYDFFFFSQFACLMLLPYLLLWLIVRNKPLLLHTFLLFSLLCFSFLLSDFYLIDRRFLVNESFLSNLNLLIESQAEQSSIQLFFKAIYLLFAGFCIFLFTRYLLRKEHRTPAWPWLLIGLSVWLLFGRVHLPRIHFPTLVEQEIISNKTAQYLADTEGLIFLEKKESYPIQGAIDSFRLSLNQADILESYPYLRSIEQSCELCKTQQPCDSLGQLVFVFVEGLSSACSGQDAKYGSYTPFLDSLAGKSLRFKNFFTSSLNPDEVIFNSITGLYPSLYFERSRLNEVPSLNSFLKDSWKAKHLSRKQSSLKLNTYFKKHEYENLNIGIKSDSLMLKQAKKVLNEPTEQLILLRCSFNNDLNGKDEARYIHMVSNLASRKGLSTAMINEHIGHFSQLLYIDQQLKSLFDSLSLEGGLEHKMFVFIGLPSSTSLSYSSVLGAYQHEAFVFAPGCFRPSSVGKVNSEQHLFSGLLQYLQANELATVPSTAAFAQDNLNINLDSLSRPILLKAEEGSYEGFLRGRSLLFKSSYFRKKSGSYRISYMPTEEERFRKEIKLWEKVAAHAYQEDKLVPKK